METPGLWYALDQRNTVADIGGTWSDLAPQAGGQDALRSSLIDRPLYGFVQGAETRQFLDGIFFNVRRAGAEYRLKYRCDAGFERRIFEMTVMPSDMVDGHLILRHSTVCALNMSNRTNVVALSDHYDSNRCSICCAIEIDGQWRDTWAAPDLTYFVRGYRICPQCQKSLRQSDHLPAEVAAPEW